METRQEAAICKCLFRAASLGTSGLRTSHHTTTFENLRSPIKFHAAGELLIQIEGDCGRSDGSLASAYDAHRGKLPPDEGLVDEINQTQFLVRTEYTTFNPSQQNAASISSLSLLEPRFREYCNDHQQAACSFVYFILIQL